MKLRKGKQKRSPRAYLGVFVEPDLKEQLQTIARSEKRSVNAQTEIFLARGVQHLLDKQPA